MGKNGQVTFIEVSNVLELTAVKIAKKQFQRSGKIVLWRRNG